MEISLTNVTVIYNKDTPFENKALDDITINIPGGQIIGIIGQSGSGKTTLGQVIAGLTNIDSGTVTIGGYRWEKNAKLPSEIRKELGILFQYPEHQLFAETVEKDVAFALNNFKYPVDEIAYRTKQALDLVNLPYEEFRDKSPFSLSGGEKRKVAIAGVLAYEPSILILDEPTAGLDPQGRKELLAIIKRLNSEQKTTVIIISHNMDEISAVSDKIIVLNKGEKIIEDKPETIFMYEEKLKEFKLDIPEITKFIIQYNKGVNKQLPLNCYTIDKLEQELIKRLEGI